MNKLILTLLLGIFLLGLGSANSITLNSPINAIDYVNGFYEATFNFSTNLTDGSIIENVSLWTNENGVWNLRNNSLTSTSGSGLEYNSGISPYNRGTLEAYFTFDNTFVSEINGYTLTNTGTTYTPSGKINGAYDFERDDIDYITTPNIIQVNNSNSICWWMNLETTGSQNWLLGRINTTTVGGEPNWYITTNGDGTEMTYCSGSNLCPATSASISSNDGNWHFYCAVYDTSINEGTKIIYEDGQEVWNETQSTDDDGLSAFYLGRYGATTSNTFDGIMDEVQFYNESLPVSEIEELYNSNKSFYEATFNRTYTTGNDVTWTGYYCNNESLCEFGSSNETLSWKIFQNNNTFNSSTYETASESFILNITANSSLSAVTLDYNGTDYAMTSSGGLWSRTIDIPEGVSNRTLRYKFTYAGDTIYSDYFYQNVSAINFSICGGALTNDFLNISFQDEADLSYINASIPTSTFTYYLGSGTINKSYTYSNITDNYNYQFCASPTDKIINVLPYVQYKQGTSYPQRTYEPAVQQYNSTATQKGLYLLGSVDGIYVTFQVINSADQTLSGVDVTAVRTINGEDVTVGVGTTSASGSVTFWLNPDFTHTFTFSKSGYTTYTYDDIPTQTSYTITLSGGSQVPIGYNRGIITNLYPTNSSLINDTIYEFGISLDSSYWDIQEYGFNLRLVNGTVVTGSSTSTLLELTSINYNVSNQSKIYMDYYWKIDGTYTNGTISWRIYSTDNTQWSIKTFFTDLNSFMDSGMFGLDNFGRFLFTFLILFFGVGIIGYKYGVTDPLFLTGLIFFLVLFLDVGIGLIPDIRVLNGNEVPHLLTFVSGLIFVVSVISEVGRR